jgi:transposase
MIAISLSTHFRFFSISHLTEKQSLEILLLHYNSKWTQKRIAKHVHCSQKTVSNTIKRFESTGSLVDRPRSGRPLLVSETVQKAVDKIIHKSPKLPASQISIRLQEGTGLKLSVRTIESYRRKLDYFPRIEHIRVHKTPQMWNNLIDHCREHINDDFKLYYFEDETSIQLRDTGGVVWLKRGEIAEPREIVNLRTRINIIGVIGWDYIYIAKYAGHWSGQLYTQLIQQALDPTVVNLRRHYLYQDRDTSHWVNAVKNWAQQNHLSLIKAPTKSPEINAIEYIWNTLKNIVSHESPTNEHELHRAVDKAISLINENQVRNTILHTKEQLREIAVMDYY